jgi:hemolysin activation/secretion protein
VSPGVLGQRLPPVIEPRPEPARPERPARPAPGIEAPRQAIEAPPGSDRVFVVLEGIGVEGMSVYTPEQIAPLYQDSIGRRVSVSRVFEIAARLEARYQEDGYLLSRVIVPAQSAEAGRFRLQAVEGFVGAVRVEGEAGSIQGRIERQLQGVMVYRPVNRRDLERYLLLVNDLPGIRAQGVLRRGVGEIGAAELVVRVERRPYEAYADLDNHGSDFKGRERLSLTLRDNANTPLGERIELFYLNSLAWEEDRYGQIAYHQPLGAEGLALDLRVGYGRSRPDLGLALETEVLDIDADLSYPLYRTRARSLYLDAGFEALDSLVDLFGIESRDRLRVFHAGARLEALDPLAGTTDLGLELRQGVEAFGANDGGPLSRPDGVPSYTALGLDASRNQDLGDAFGLYLAASGQYAFRPLLSLAEFTVGSEQFGRGYDPAALSGDSGLGLAVEASYRHPGGYGPWRGSQAYVFYDLGVVWNRAPEGAGRASLSSIGLGIRNRITDYVSADLELAFPLTGAPANPENDSSRLLFRVAARF